MQHRLATYLCIEFSASRIKPRFLIDSASSVGGGGRRGGVDSNFQLNIITILKKFLGATVAEW